MADSLTVITCSRIFEILLRRTIMWNEVGEFKRLYEACREPRRLGLFLRSDGSRKPLMRRGLCG